MNGEEMLSEIKRRREIVADRIAELKGHLSSAADRVAGKACVYATGSFGRLEAGPDSDLDLFIVGLDESDGRKRAPKSKLSNLDATLVKADLISATRELKIKDFDGDGRYLTHFSVNEIADSLGTADDDYKNTLTSRLLMLLESTPLLDDGAYKKIIDELLFRYWRDYADHKADFVPAFFGNDIIRLWRTFCVNYEARTEREPEEKKMKGKIKNYKLKHSRLLTCYSALLYMLEVYNKNRCVTPDDAREMVHLTPTKRLDWLKESSENNDVKDKIDQLLHLYDNFLISTADESALGASLMDPARKSEYASSTYKFGDTVFEIMSLVGNQNRLHRLLVV